MISTNVQSLPAEDQGIVARSPQWVVWVGSAVVLLATTLLAYQPAWHGGILWDDEAHITKPELRSASGLWRIWFEPGATQQYYPLTCSVFWLQYRQWQDNTLGYHLVNVVLHVTVALLLVAVLQRLGAPGAWLAGVIFALHPVQVESVAWITELKNVLSGVFYLSAALTYLYFDERRRPMYYAMAAAFFFLALMSKTVTATLPAALLVVFWWKRGRLEWRRDVLPLLPFFLAGLISGLFTAWVEHKFVGAGGSEYEFTFVERGLIAGRVIWFYLSKLCWPTNLMFMYPRWQVSQKVWWQYLFPLCVLGLLTALWLLRRRTRAPLAAVLFFCGTLFPALGFFNVYPFRYSLVADHFQYLASIGIITLFAATVARLVGRLRVNQLAMLLISAAIIIGVASPLGILTRRQCRQYVDVETLYRETLSLNPTCWLFLNNLGNLERNDGRTQEAIQHLRLAVQLKPDLAEAHNNLATPLQATGQVNEAIEHYREALRLKPEIAVTHNNLGTALRTIGKRNEAILEYKEALRLDPELEIAHCNMATILLDLNQAELAAHYAQEAIRIKPDFAEAHFQLGKALQLTGQADRAIRHYLEAVRLDPSDANAYNNLGTVLQTQGRFQEAMRCYGAALRLKPDLGLAYGNLGFALQSTGHTEEAIQYYLQALRLMPNDAQAHDNFGAALADLGQFEEAEAQFRAALAIEPDFAAAKANLEKLEIVRRKRANGSTRAAGQP
ncbi:MAG: tetratricopeptide repeat protein [Planctomycetes bacterium]|nr:tetratricopeptide repeat protein [Planctomycetota bacterium]